MSLNLRAYQTQSIEALRAGFAAGHRSQILYAPTGAGKTEMAIALLAATKTKGNKAAMILDRVILCDQTSQRLQKYSIDHGVLQAGHWRYRPYEPIQVCSAQTLEKRGSFPGLTLMVVDECHATRKQTIDFIRDNPDIKVVGLSATPFTKGLGKVYQNVVSTVTTEELVKAKVLSPLRVFIAKEINMEGAKKVAGEWSQAESTERGMKITGDIVAEWVSKTHEIFGKPRKTIVFCSGVAHGADLAKKFAAAGYNFISISYKDDEQFKKDVIEDFSKPDTEIHGLIATDILTKGFDCVLEGSMVLTDNGLVRIEEVTIDAKIWDGHEFVSHGGAIYKGVRNVITYAGLTATPDHLVKTKEGWVSFGRCASEQISIVATGNGGKAIQEHEGCFAGTQKKTGQTEMGCNTAFAMRLRRLWRAAMDELEHYPKGFLEWLSKLRKSKKSSTMACHEVQRNGCTLSERVSQTLQKLWWSWDQIQFQFCAGCGELDSRKSRITGATPQSSIGQNKQRWPLRARESTLGKQVLKLQQHAARWVDGKNAQISLGARRDQICRQNFEKSFFSRHDGGTDYREVSQKIGQTEGRVWDILNAGSRNSFTCQGLLIHNCEDVMIGVSARPFSKSLSSHIQQMGRVMRGHAEKDYAIWLCMAKGSLVLTDAGLVPIDKVALTHKIWDGTNFVTHNGAVCNGIQTVITYQGLTATSGHLVHTAEGWRTFGDCANKQIRITQTGFGGQKIRLREDLRSTSFLVGRKAKAFYSRFVRMCSVWLSKLDFFVKPAGRENEGMPIMQSTGCKLPNVVVQPGTRHAGALLFACAFELSSLRWSWSRVQIFWCKRRYALDYGKSWLARIYLNGKSIAHSIGSNRPEWSLRAGQFKMAFSGAKSAKQTRQPIRRQNSQVQNGSPRDSLFRQHLEGFLLGWHDSQGNCGEIQQAIHEAQREVWDILDAGPNNRFTCEGLLVHNCHSGNYLRFQEEWEQIYETGVQQLDDTKEKTKKEKTDKEKEAAKCPKCGAFWPSNSDTCLHCGHVRERQNKVQNVSGEMHELVKGMGRDDKQDWWSMCQYKMQYSGWSNGRAAHTYKDKYGVWPRGLADVPKAPDIVFERAVKTALRKFIQGKR